MIPFLAVVESSTKMNVLPLSKWERVSIKRYPRLRDAFHVLLK